MNSTRNILALAVLTAAAVFVPAEAGAQRSPPQGGRSGAAAQRPDTLNRPPLAQALDYQNQDLGVVFNALAEAANLNITMSAIPTTRVTVRMARGATRDTLVSMIRSLAEANNVRFTAQGSLIRLEGDPNASPAAQAAANQLALQQQQAAQAAQNQLRLFTYRLKHASAVEVAPVLMNLLGGAQVGGQNFTILPGGGVQINPGGVQGPGRGGNQPAAPGRGGVQTLPPVSIATPDQGGRGNQAANQQALIERAMAQLGQGGRGGGAAGQAIQQLLQQQLAGIQGATQGGGAGVLSNTAAQIRIVADVSTNSLLIRASTADYALIQGLVQTIDLRPLQVLIEVTIAEVQRSSDMSLGIGGTATRKGATANAPRDTVGILPGNPSARDFILQLAGGNGSINYRVALNALESRGNVKVLSLPVIIAQNNKQAVLNVGEQRPFVQVNQSIQTGAVPTTTQTIQYIPVGTTLTITPTINADGYVNMAVDQTNDAATTEVQFDAPVISKRQATTQIFLKDGQTTVIGGLAGNNTSKTTSGIPILSRIPWLGALFGNTTTVTTTNELFLFLTPHIISSDEDINRFRDALQGNTDLLKDIPLGPRIVPPGDSARTDTTRRRPPSSPFKK
jgi:type II secretory pathway component GspD/PulD (secretin)